MIDIDSINEELDLQVESTYEDQLDGEAIQHEVLMRHQNGGQPC